MISLNFFKLDPLTIVPHFWKILEGTSRDDHLCGLFVMKLSLGLPGISVGECIMERIISKAWQADVGP